ncbi:potassium/sodium hyperpolarization-activated cyclic nucleotide-gated channel 1-like [Phymastichus coffea]|uniref:potassium/sodium hyperpolarization-activated cyclic nucleotide-gated channel 1-like n=1 Tax=Phymastichus coffea TaxID=108790 RepID=UPI00273B6C4C|nr:potassium/sodium hyperpolarization-activated cyclic nucleotide-gated channel 1-like [Phymastichus coffea]
MPITHRCELTKTSAFEVFESQPKCFCCLYDLIRPWITINQTHPKCRQYLVSLAAVNKEKTRHASVKHWWTIHPFSKIRLYWELIMTIVYFIAFLTIPFQICFVVLDYKTIDLDNLNLFIYFLCWIDIILNCVTGFYNKSKDRISLDQGAILKRYLKTFMVIDVLSSLPYDRLTLSWRKVPGPENSLIATLINLLPLLKLTRYFTFKSYLRQIFLHVGNENVSCQMLLTLLLYVYIVHWFACFCNVTPLIMMYAQHESVDQSEDSWLATDEIKGIAQRYRQALFIVLENFTASGYGGIEPRSEGHITICTILMILGRLFESYITIMLMQIVADRKSSESKYEQIVNQLSAYARQKQLPAYMKQRLWAYYHYRFRNSYFREKKILINLSDALKEEVTLHACRRLVENVEIFQELPKNVLTQIVTNLKPELYLERDMIIRAGTQGDCMFFLSSGTVVVLTPTGKEVCHLEDGAHFGEVALLVQDQRRVASIVAVEVCEVYRLDRKDFRKFITVYSDLYAKIEQIATERMQRTVMIEEQHKRFNMLARRATIALPQIKKN